MFVATLNINSIPNVGGCKRQERRTPISQLFTLIFYGNIDVLLKKHDICRRQVSYNLTANHTDVRTVPFELLCAAVFLYAYSADSRLFTTLNNHVTC
jgi:hypothetical protein